VKVLDGIRAIFFDAVGTLLFPDPPAGVIYVSAAARRGLDIDSATIRTRFLAAHRAEEDVDRAAGWVTSEAREVMRWRRIVGECLIEVPDREACFQELFGHFASPAAWRVDAGLPHVLTTLRSKGIQLGIGSNYDGRLRSVLDGLPELALLRERAVISAEVGHRKPATEFFRAVTRAAGCEPGAILFVGDDFENDYEGARMSGLKSVLFGPRNANRGLRDIITDLGQLLSWE
jgi:putative hydrolase of the HAD superfamily